MYAQNANSTLIGSGVVWLTTILAAFTADAVDPGDVFADRPNISGLAGQVTGSTVDATRETGEPNHAGLEGGASVWRSWTAPATGPVTFDTLGSGFDTLLAAYVGNAVELLTLVDSSDDIQWPTNLLSQLSFDAQQGVSYAVVVDGYEGEAGDFTLNWVQDPVVPAEHTLTLSGTGYGHVLVNGTEQPLPYSETFDVHAQVLVEAVPLGGWQFTGWSGDLSGSTNPSVVKMTGDWEIAVQFERDQTLNLVNVPWYVDAAGPAKSLPPEDGQTCSFVFLNNGMDDALECYIEYYTKDGVFIGPFDDNTFSVPAGASIAFRPVADDPATAGGQEAAPGLAVPNRPVNKENGNDGKANGSIVIRFRGDPGMLTGQVQSYADDHVMGPFSIAYSLPDGIVPAQDTLGVCSTSVPWYVDNAAPGQAIPPQDGYSMSIVYLHNNRDSELTCLIEYFTQGGIFIGPTTENTFTLPPNASVAFRPVADDPTGAGGQEPPLGAAVPNRPRGTDGGNDNKKNGSIRIKWLGHPNDVQGIITTYSYSTGRGAHASSSLLPPAVVRPAEED